MLAAAKARKGKSRRPDVEAWWQRRESAVLRLSAQLSGGTWQPGGYRLFEIREPKRRMIAAAPFEDRVVHHALCNLMQPVLERRFIARSFSCQVGKGTTAARECCRQLVNRHRYVLKCDVRKFFDSIPHDILLEKLAKRLRCPGVLELCRRIIHSYSAVDHTSGLPIGNLTSQLWGNFILDELDHWITEDQRHGAYLRYTDDFLIFGDDPSRLWELRAGIQEKLAALKLHLAEPKSRLLTTAEGVPFCGFRLHPGLRARVLGTTKRRFEARRRRACKAAWSAMTVAVQAWYAFSEEGNTLGLRRDYAKGIPSSRSPSFYPS
jgi:RNA-directed DNA polymerase